MFDRFPTGITRHSWDARSLGVGCIYFCILCLALPLHPRVFLVSLALGAGLLIYTIHETRLEFDGILVSVSGFLLCFAASVVQAIEPDRALISVITAVPTLLLGYLIASRLSLLQIDRLSWVFTLAIGIAAGYLVLVALSNLGQSPQRWLQLTGYQHFSVPNDLLCFALLSPFPITLLYSRLHWCKKLLIIIMSLE